MPMAFYLMISIDFNLNQDGISYIKYNVDTVHTYQSLCASVTLSLVSHTQRARTLQSLCAVGW